MFILGEVLRVEVSARCLEVGNTKGSVVVYGLVCGVLFVWSLPARRTTSVLVVLVKILCVCTDFLRAILCYSAHKLEKVWKMVK
jgi:hypothetical protein